MSTATPGEHPMANVVLFPPPPPTTNALSAAQRTRLMRSTMKLGRILGATPHFVDAGPGGAEVEERRYRGSNNWVQSRGVFNDMSPSPSPSPYPTLRSDSRASTDSRSSCTSTESASSSFTSTTTSSSSLLTRSSSSSSLRTSSRSRKPLPQHDTWPTRKPPMLRLALSSSSSPPTLEPIPASPLTPQSTTTMTMTTTRQRPTHHRGTPPLDGSSPSPVETTTTTPPPTSEPSPTSPTFTIPHPAAPAARRAKMERLRRTLGEGVPVRLVFPPPFDDGGDDDGDGDYDYDFDSASGSGSEPSLGGTSPSCASSEETLDTPDTSPVLVSGGKALPAVHVHVPVEVEVEVASRRARMSPLTKRGIKYTRDSVADDGDAEGGGGSSPHRAARKGRGGGGVQMQMERLRAVGLPVASRPAPPPPPPPPTPPRYEGGLKPKGDKSRGVLRKLAPGCGEAYCADEEGREQEQERPVVTQHWHRRSSTSTSTTSTSTSTTSTTSTSSSRSSTTTTASGPLLLDVIHESPLELELKDSRSHSGWFGSDNEDDDDRDEEGADGSFEVLGEEEVLEAAMSDYSAGRGGWVSGLGLGSGGVDAGCGYRYQYRCGYGYGKGKGKGRGLARSYGRVRAVAGV